MSRKMSSLGHSLGPRILGRLAGMLSFRKTCPVQEKPAPLARIASLRSSKGRRNRLATQSAAASVVSDYGARWANVACGFEAGDSDHVDTFRPLNTSR